MSGLPWASMNVWNKMLHIGLLLTTAPFLCFCYITSPKRDHKNTQGLWGSILRQLDRPFNRFVLDTYSYCIFLALVLISVLHSVGTLGPKEEGYEDSSIIEEHKQHRHWVLVCVSIWVGCYIARDLKTIALLFIGEKNLSSFRFIYDLVVHILFALAISFKVHGYSMTGKAGAGKGSGAGNNLEQTHPINIGANLYGVAACLAFLRMIFIFEIHHRVGPILFCIKNVFWDIISVTGSYIITMVAFGVGLRSVFGTQNNESFSNFASTFKRLFWIIFDPGQEDITDIGPKDDGESLCCSTPKPTTITFARPAPGVPVATYNPLNDADQSIAHNVGIYMWSFYQVLVVLIMLNLLISLMTTTFARIQSNADMEWKFTRASTWIHYYDDNHAIPVPFNVIPSVYGMQKFVKWLKSCCCPTSKIDGSASGSNKKSLFGSNRTSGSTGAKPWLSFRMMEEQEARRQEYNALIERVFRCEDKTRQDTSVNRIDLDAIEKEISIDIAELRRDLRALRRDLLAKIGNTAPTTHNTINALSNNKTETTQTNQQLGPGLDSVPELDLKEDRKQQVEQLGDSVEEQEEEGGLDRKRTFTMTSYKADNNPEAVQHLVQTLGLIGGPAMTPNTFRKQKGSNDQSSSTPNLEVSYLLEEK